MRTREAGFIDYGITDGECKGLLEICRNANGEQELMLLKAAQESNELFASELYYSLRKNVSFDELDMAHRGLCIYVGDFYAYRRKTLFLFREKLMADTKDIVEQWKKDGSIRRYLSKEDAAAELQVGVYKLNELAKKANAYVILVGNTKRINMNALYDYIDRECVAR